MFWGDGSALGLLTFLGYGVFVLGAALMWRSRGEVTVWMQEDYGTLRRSFSRYTVIGPFYKPREESRIKEVPNLFTGFCARVFRRMSHLPATSGARLIFIGSLLVLLDFFI